MAEPGELERCETTETYGDDGYGCSPSMPVIRSKLVRFPLLLSKQESPTCLVEGVFLTKATQRDEGAVRIEGSRTTAACSVEEAFWGSESNHD